MPVILYCDFKMAYANMRKYASSNQNKYQFLRSSPTAVSEVIFLSENMLGDGPWFCIFFEYSPIRISTVNSHLCHFLPKKLSIYIVSLNERYFELKYFLDWTEVDRKWTGNGPAKFSISKNSIYWNFSLRYYGTVYTLGHSVPWLSSHAKLRL